MDIFRAFLSLIPYQPNAHVEFDVIRSLTSASYSSEDLNATKQRKTQTYRVIFFDSKLLLQNETHTLTSNEVQTLYDDLLQACQDQLNELGSKVAPFLPALLNAFSDFKHYNKCTQLIHHCLSYENNLKVLLPLTKIWIDTPTTFIAIMDCLMRFGVSAETIISSEAIKDYILFYYSTLSQTTNPVQQLHDTLKKQIHTFKLAQLMSNTKLIEKGLDHGAMDGAAYDPNKALDVIHFEEKSGAIQKSADNVQQLSYLFGSQAIVYALRFIPQSYALEHYLNTSQIGCAQLIQIIRQIQYIEFIKEPLVEILSPQTLDTLIRLKCDGLYCLATHSEYLRNTLLLTSTSDLILIVQSIMNAIIPDFDKAANLSILLRCYTHPPKRDCMQQHGLIVYNKLLDIILRTPSLLDDEALLKQLRRFKPGHVLIQNKVLELGQNFNEFLKTNITEECIFDIIHIQDAWLNAYRPYDKLRFIHDIPSQLPKDKFQLFTRIAGHCIKKSPDQFCVERFMQLLLLNQANTPNAIHEVSVYERTLIELLVTFDHNVIRNKLVSILNRDISSLNHWISKQYGSKSLLYLAIHHGNLGLLTWLEEMTPKLPMQKNSIDHFARHASQQGHWHITIHFMRYFRLNTACMNALLAYAVEQEKSEVIPKLWQSHKKSPDVKHVEKGFLKATEQCDLRSVQALMNCPNPPCDTILARGYKQAIKNGYYNIAITISAKADSNPKLHDAVIMTKLPSRKNITALFGQSFFGGENLLSAKNTDPKPISIQYCKSI